MSMIKVGDFVEVKTWEEMEQEFGTVNKNGVETINCEGYFVPDMKELCGRKFKVEEIYPSGALNGIVVINGSGYGLNSDMVKIIEESEFNEEYKNEEECNCPSCTMLRMLKESEGTAEVLDELNESVKESLGFEEFIVDQMFGNLLDKVNGADIESLKMVIKTLDVIDDKMSQLRIAIDQEIEKQNNEKEYNERFEKFSDLHKRMQMFADEHNDPQFNPFTSEKLWVVECNGKGFDVDWYCSMTAIGEVYYSSRDIATKAMEEFGDEILAYYNFLKR